MPSTGQITPVIVTKGTKLPREAYKAAPSFWKAQATKSPEKKKRF
jgi:hypothetical protein